MEPATGIVAKVVLELFREVVLPHSYCLRCWLNLAWTIFYEAGASDCMLHDYVSRTMLLLWVHLRDRGFDVKRKKSDCISHCYKPIEPVASRAFCSKNLSSVLTLNCFA